MISMGFALALMQDTSESRTWVGVVIIVGIASVYIGIKRIIKSFVTLFLPKGEEGDLVDLVYQKRYLERGPKIAVIGGGTGLSVLLSGLKEYTSNITAIVTVADDGGSSGRLRQELDVLPPGDIRSCLVALADSEPLMSKLFQFRFAEGEGLKGHNFGNLFITAMSKVAGDFETAIKQSSRILAIRGRVVPSTLKKVSLVARYKDGNEVVGESEIPKKNQPIERMRLEPANPVPTDEATDAIRKADAIILGPGSLYTSVVPNLLIRGITDEVVASSALKIYICNVMTQPGETDNYSASAHLKVLLDHSGPKTVDYSIVNNAQIPEHLLDKYKEEGAYPVLPDYDKIRSIGYGVIAGDVINTSDYVRHDSKKLAKKIIDLIISTRKSRQ